MCCWGLKVSELRAWGMSIIPPMVVCILGPKREAQPALFRQEAWFGIAFLKVLLMSRLQCLLVQKH